MRQKKITAPGEVVEPQVFEKAIREGLKEKFPKFNLTKPKKNFSPSKVGFGGGKCARHWFYHFQGDITTVDKGDYKSQLKRYFGTVNHEALQAMVPTDRGWEEEIKAINEDPPIFGYIDIYDPENNVPVEIKNTDDAKFREAKENNIPNESHLIQTLLYMKIKQAKQGVILYVNRTTLEMHGISIMITQRYIDYINEMFDWMRRVKSASDEGQLPNRPEGFKQESFPCTFCPFNQHCWSDETEPAIQIEKLRDLVTK
jgi:CRISPR/Cas system-associated exonuclease Cas4 (RecB family)